MYVRVFENVFACVCVCECALCGGGKQQQRDGQVLRETTVAAVTTGLGARLRRDGNGSSSPHRIGARFAPGALPDRSRRRRQRLRRMLCRVHGACEAAGRGSQWAPWETHGSRLRPRPSAFWLATGHATTHRAAHRIPVSAYVVYLRRRRRPLDCFFSLRRRLRPHDHDVDAAAAALPLL